MYKQHRKLNGDIDQEIIILVERNMFVPFDPANTDYQAYLKWLAEGNEPLPADEPSTPEL